jgi:hypothetical protein
MKNPPITIKSTAPVATTTRSVSAIVFRRFFTFCVLLPVLENLLGFEEGLIVLVSNVNQGEVSLELEGVDGELTF